MKISNIEQDDTIFTVTRSPNLLQRLFMMKEKKEIYKDTGRTYHYFPSMRVYINKDGEILGPLKKMTDVLENWRRRI